MSGFALGVMGCAAAAGGAAVVSITGDTYYDGAGGTAQAFVRFETDGTKDAKDDAGTSQRDASTDWIIPNGAASSSYEIFATQTSGDVPDAGSSAEDTWIDLGTARRWGHIKSTGKGTSSGVWDIDIRFSGGPVLASGTFTTQAERF